MQKMNSEAAALVLEGLTSNGLLDPKQVQEMIKKAEDFLGSFQGVNRATAEKVVPPMSIEEARARVHAMTKARPTGDGGSKPSWVFTKADLKEVTSALAVHFHPKSLNVDPTVVQAKRYASAYLNEAGRAKFNDLVRLGGNIIRAGRQIKILSFEKRIDRRMKELKNASSSYISRALGGVRAHFKGEVAAFERQGLSGADLLVAMAREYGAGL